MTTNELVEMTLSINDDMRFKAETENKWKLAK